MTATIVDFIKCRIGEPLTAVDISKTHVTFGSISGYIGIYDMNIKLTKYVDTVFEELIREIEINAEKEEIKAMVGDRCIMIINFANLDDFQMTRLSYDSVHNPTYCPNMISFIRNGLALLAYFPTPNSDKPYLFLKDEKPKTKYIDTEQKTVTVLEKFLAWDLPVPMDFTGKKILWLEYNGSQHTLMLFDCNTQEKIECPVTSDEKNKHSHIKFFNKDDEFVSVRNYKNIYKWSWRGMPGEFLYKHDYTIVSYCFDTEKIISIDVSAILKIYNIKQKSCTKILQTSLMNFPSTVSDYKQFDMGYPYYMALEENNLAFTTDLGLFVLKLD